MYSDADKGCNKLLHNTVVKSKIDFCRSKVGDGFWFLATFPKSRICLRPLWQISASRTTCINFYKAFSRGRNRQKCLFLCKNPEKAAKLGLPAIRKSLVKFGTGCSRC